MRLQLVPLTLIFFVMLVVVPNQVQAEAVDNSYKVDVIRDVHVNEWSLVQVNDTFIIHNGGTDSISSLQFGLPRNFRSYVKYSLAVEPMNHRLPLTSDLDPSSHYYWMRVDFTHPIQPGKTFNFTAMLILWKAVQFIEKAYVYQFPSYPVLTTTINSVNSTVTVPPGSTITTQKGDNRTEVQVGGQSSVIQRFRGVEAYSSSMMSFNYTSISAQLADVRYLERVIELHQDGSISVRDTYDIMNLATPIQSLPMSLPKNASNIMAYDNAGPIWQTSQSGEFVSVKPRYGDVRQHVNLTFSLSYSLEPKAYVKQVDWWGRYNFTIDLQPKVYFTVDKMNVTLIVPEGFSVQQTSLEPRLTSSSDPYQKEIHYHFEGVTAYSELTLKITFKYPPFWSSFQPLGWLGLFELTLAAVVVSLKLRKTPTAEIPVPVQTIRQFVEAYDEKSTLRTEIEHMDMNMARGGLSKHEYRRKRKFIDDRIDELDKIMSRVKTELRNMHPRYDEMIKKLEKADAEIGAARASETQVRNQYRSGKIAKNVHDTLLNDLRKRVDRARQTIDTVIVALREEAR